jgi:4a-hydroxytetrahydrobiopterin dehydratase
MKALSTEKIEDFISKNLPGWQYKEGFLIKGYKFRDFTEAFSFMTSVALTAEKMDHHPEWSNVYNTVIIKLRTHSAAGITSLDLELASTAERLSLKYA